MSATQELSRPFRTTATPGQPMILRLIDWIWHVRGTVPLAPGQTADEALDRLDPLFRQPGTTYHRNRDGLTFRKKDQAAQDKMSVFDGGDLRIEPGATGPVLRYHLISRALLACFLAPLLFIGFAQLTIALGTLEKPAASAPAHKPAAKPEVIQLNPIDKALGAPEPEKPGKDVDMKRDKKPSPTAAYVFAGIFAALYLVGRVLEDRLVRRLFRRRLLGA